MMLGTSPSITPLFNSGYEAAFQANTGDVWDAPDWTAYLIVKVPPESADLERQLRGPGWGIMATPAVGPFFWETSEAGRRPLCPPGVPPAPARA